MQTLTPGVFTHIQHQFIQVLTQAFPSVNHIAIVLFYLLAAIELVIFGLMWALRKDISIGDFVLKILKLGILFGVLTLFPWLIQSLINGFTEIASGIAPQASSVMMNPALIWKIGFNAGILLLKSGIHFGVNLSAGLIYSILGFGILFLFGLIGAQIILVMIGFYLTGILSLLFLPFGAFSSSHSFFEKAISNLFKMGVRVFTVSIIIGVGMLIWAHLIPSGSLISKNFADNLMAPMGLFFSALVIVILIYQLPKIMTESIGTFKLSWLKNAIVSSNSVDHFSHSHSNSQSPENNSSSIYNLTAATTIQSQPSSPASQIGPKQFSSSPSNIQINLANSSHNKPSSSKSSQSKTQSAIDLNSSQSQFSQNKSKLKSTFKSATDTGEGD